MLRSSRHYLAQSQGDHIIGRLEERDVERGSAGRYNLKRTNIENISKATSGKTSGRRGGTHMSFSKRIDPISRDERNCRTRWLGSWTCGTRAKQKTKQKQTKKKHMKHKWKKRKRKKKEAEQVTSMRIPNKANQTDMFFACVLCLLQCKFALLISTTWKHKACILGTKTYESLFQTPQKTMTTNRNGNKITNPCVSLENGKTTIRRRRRRRWSSSKPVQKEQLWPAAAALSELTTAAVPLGRHH